MEFIVLDVIPNVKLVQSSPTIAQAVMKILPTPSILPKTLIASSLVQKKLSL